MWLQTALWGTEQGVPVAIRRDAGMFGAGDALLEFGEGGGPDGGGTCTRVLVWPRF